MSPVVEVQGRGGHGFVLNVDAAGNAQTIVNGLKDPEDGYVAQVAADRSLHVKVTNIVVVVRAPLIRSASTGGSVSTTSGQVAPAEAERKAITFFNAGANTARINFGDAATSDDLAIAPGERVTFDSPGGEEVFAKTDAGSTHVTVYEFVPDVV